MIIVLSPQSIICQATHCPLSSLVMSSPKACICIFCAAASSAGAPEGGPVAAGRAGNVRWPPIFSSSLGSSTTTSSTCGPRISDIRTPTQYLHIHGNTTFDLCFAFFSKHYQLNFLSEGFTLILFYFRNTLLLFFICKKSFHRLLIDFFLIYNNKF